MHLQFPNDFFWGTSTASAQIETASDHSFKGLRSRDGHIFDRTSDHEKRRTEDAQHIQRFGTIYRCSVDWARLQTEPMGAFHHDVVEEYKDFFKQLTEGGTKIMFVLHHFANPKWFEEKGGWLYEENIGFFSDFTKKCIHNFGKYVSYWNTFNEPNSYAFSAYMSGDFPPFRKSYFKANEVLGNMGIAHDTVYTMLKVHDATKPIGISLFTALFTAKNVLGWLPAKFADWWFHTKTANHFEKCDFWGLSYYANIIMNPFPVSEIHQPGKLDKMGLKHDKMWAYEPKGLGIMLRRFSKKYQKPVIVCENGICTDSDNERIEAIKDYLQEVHSAIKSNVHVAGYIHWSTFDNYEWHLGPSFQFGLMRVDPETKDRIDTPAARFYEQVTKQNSVEV